MASVMECRMAKCILFLIPALIVACVYIYDSLEPHLEDGKRRSLFERMRYEWEELGLDVPAYTSEYYSSVMGSPYKHFRGRVAKPSHPLRPTQMENIRCEWFIKPPEMECTFVCDVYSRPFFIWHRHTVERYTLRTGVSEMPDRTAALLASTSAGTELWKRSISQKDSYLYAHSSVGPIPAIAFCRPSTEKELEDYWQWLESMAGSLDRFRDDWGHRVRLTIEGKPGFLLLVSASAGPDGRWGSNDDMILERDVKTGDIVAKTGFEAKPGTAPGFDKGAY